MAKIKLETSNSTPSHNSWPWNSGLQIMPLGLRDYCHLPINFNCQSYYLATNGNSFMQFTLLLIASLWSCLSLIVFLSFIYFFLLFAKEKRWCSGFFLYVHWSQRGQPEGVRLLKSTTPICLSVRCLAWLSSTQRWCWQNDRRGAHSSECQFSCRALLPQNTEAPTHQNRKRREL